MTIHEYASRGDCDGIRKELRNGVSVNARDERDCTPLACAASNSSANIEALQLLIDAGADVNAAVDGSKSFPVGLAACSGDLSKVRCLLEVGANINFVSPKGYTILINVMYSLHDDENLVPMVNFLVANGAKTECETDYGESPLSVASIQGRIDAVEALLNAGADSSRLKWTELMMAVVLRKYEEVERLVESGSGFDGRDKFGRTAWLLASVVGDVKKAQLLLAHGAKLDERGRMGDTALMIRAAKGNDAMLQWLIETGADIDAVDDAGNTALILAAQGGATTCVQLLLKASADPSHKNTYNQNAMLMASNEPIIRLLAQAGENIGDISTEMKRKLLGLEAGDSLNVSQSQYLSGRHPRFGKSNPEVMQIPFWNEMVRSGICAYFAKVQFGDTGEKDGPIWCFDRFGKSFTELPDGRFIQIGGEHEDHYDPDFCIYNDVIVHDHSGNFKIMGYPKDVFPPTDFHSATHVDGSIYIIGGLGYHGSRLFGTTPVYRLNCRTWKIEAIRSSGENPGWIYDHKASSVDSNVIVVSSGKICQEIDGNEQHLENKETFKLDLSNMKWNRI